MIKAILVLNDHGKPRLLKFFETHTHLMSVILDLKVDDPILTKAEKRQDVSKQGILVAETFKSVSRRTDFMCNFIECDGTSWEKGTKIIYRHYATLYFIFVVDSSESELGILDLIQTFVESLDTCFKDVCELDLIFNMEKIHYILDEIIQGGMVIETRKDEILKAVTEMKAKEASEEQFLSSVI